jgi:hypothetical protein
MRTSLQICWCTCRCILSKAAQWEMEDWLHFTETLSELVLPFDMLDRRLVDIWAPLQRAVCFYFRATHPTTGRYRFTPEVMRAASQDIWLYEGVQYVQYSTLA